MISSAIGALGWALAGPFGPSFQPSDVPGLVADWSADDAVIDVGVGSVPDSSGNSNTIAQATTGGQPSRTLGWRNGHALINHASGKSLFRAALTQGTLAQPYTIVWIGELGAGTALSTLVGSRDATNRAYIANELVQGRFAAWASSSIYSANVSTGPTVTIQAFNGSSYYGRLIVNGAGLSPASGNPGSKSLQGVTVGAAYNDTQAPTTGGWSRVLIYDHVLTTDERDAIEAWASSEYSIEVESDSALATLTDNTGRVFAAGLGTPVSGALANEGRTFGDATQRNWISTPTPTAVLNALKSNFTMICRLKTQNAITSGLPIGLINWPDSPGSETDPSNYLPTITFSTTGRLRLYYERTASGTNVESYTPNNVVSINTIHTLALRGAVNGSNIDFDVFVDGVIVHSYTGLPASGGEDSSFRIYTNAPNLWVELSDVARSDTYIQNLDPYVDAPDSNVLSRILLN